MGLRYGLLAALTLVLACALLWDRLHPPRSTALFPRDLPTAEETVRVVVGGSDPAPAPAAPPGEPAAPPPAVLPPPAPPPSPTREPAGGEREYAVVAGDTLSGIAAATLGSSRRAGEIAAHNGMKVTDTLRIGQVLRIPPAGPSPAAGRTPAPAAAAPGPPAAEPPTPRSHTIGKGDTLYGIARRYYGDGSRWREVADANGLGEGDPLRVGSVLRLP